MTVEGVYMKETISLLIIRRICFWPKDKVTILTQECGFGPTSTSFMESSLVHWVTEPAVAREGVQILKFCTNTMPLRIQYSLII